MSTPFAVIAFLLAALVGGSLLFGDGDEDAPPRPGFDAAELARVAERVERLRGVRFRRPPRAATISQREAKSALLGDIDKGYPRTRRNADERILELLELIPPSTSIDKVFEDLAGGGVAGFYDVDGKRLFVLNEATPGGVTREITLAHELTHALEDEAFGLEEPDGGVDDATTAYAALVEGSASYVMGRYLERFVGSDRALGAVVEALGLPATPDLPPYIQSSLLFPYQAGERFVSELRRRTGDWSLVDFALEKRPPDSTEQIIHPEKYLRFERPVRVRLPLPGPGWRRIASGTIGEYDTYEILKLAGDDRAAGDAAAGWGGASIGLWRRGSETGCAQPCRGRHVLALAWQMDTVRDARELARALDAYARRGLRGTDAGDGDYELAGGRLALRRRGRSVALVAAPGARLAARMAAAALP